MCLNIIFNYYLMELSKNRLKSKKFNSHNSNKVNQDVTISNKVFKENQVNSMHIIVNPKDKFLFLYTFLKKFSDKSMLVLFSTNSEAKVSSTNKLIII
jgi:hypothetical protein